MNEFREAMVIFRESLALHQHFCSTQTFFLVRGKFFFVDSKDASKWLSAVLPYDG
jgi:hypothetical protein